MADLLRTKLLHSSSLLSLSSFPSDCCPHPFILRIPSLRRRTVTPTPSYSRSSSVFATLSPNSTRFGIVSTTEHPDGSVVFKFGDISVTETDTSQGLENVNGSDVHLESDQTKVLSSINSKLGDDNRSTGVEDSTVNEVNENDGTEKEFLTQSEIQPQHILLESTKQDEAVEDDQNHDLISIVEMENSSISALTNNVASNNDSIVDLVVESSIDSELVMHGVGVETFVATSNSSEGLIIAEKSKEMSEVATAVSSSQLELSGSELLEGSEKTSYLEASEPVVSTVDNNGHNLFHKEYDDNYVAESPDTNSPVEASDMTSSLGEVELDSNGKHVVDEDDTDNVVLEALDTAVSLENDNGHRGVEQLAIEELGEGDSLDVAETNSPVGVSDIVESLDVSEHNIDVTTAGNVEDDNNDMLEIAETTDTNSLIGASDIVESLDVSEHNIDFTHVANVEDDNSDMFEIAETNLGVEASDVAVPLEGDERASDVKQVVNEKYDGNGVLEIAETNSPIEVTNIAVSLEEHEHDKDLKQVRTMEDNDNDLVDAAEATSSIEPSGISVSLEDDKHDNVAEELMNEEHGDNDTTGETNSAIEASDSAVLLEGGHDSDMKQMVNEEDGESMLQEIASINSVIDGSDIAVSLEDNELDSNVKQEPKEDDINGKLHKIADAESSVDASDVAVSPADREFDRNEEHILNEDDDSVELMDRPVSQETEPILDEEADRKSEENVVTLEPISGSNMVDEAATVIIPQSEDDLSGVDSLEAASPEPVEIAAAEANVDSMRSTESTSPTFNVFSAAASLAHPGEALTGPEDAYFVCQNWIGLADGVGQWSFTGTDTGRYAQELMRNLEKLALNTPDAGSTDVKNVLQKIADNTESGGSARVLIAHFSNKTLHVANIGDTGFVIIRNGAAFKKSTPIVHEFNFPYAIGSGVDSLEAVEEYHIQLEDGDVIIAATDGLFDNLYEQEIASIVSKSVDAGIKPKELAEVLVKIAQEVGSFPHGRSPFADAAQAAGHTGVIGGKLDHVTVIVSLVQIK